MALRRSTTWTGSCTFRLEPGDLPADGPSTAELGAVGRAGAVLRYAWRHPDDGDQEGALLVGSGEAPGTVEVAWHDSWHQSAGLMHLTGAGDVSGFEATGHYAEVWTWVVVLAGGPEELTVTMRNGPPGEPAYDVMVARWRPSAVPAGATTEKVRETS